MYVITQLDWVPLSEAEAPLERTQTGLSRRSPTCRVQVPFMGSVPISVSPIIADQKAAQKDQYVYKLTCQSTVSQPEIALQ